jgi:Protein of unknown function (DUF3305)
LRSTALARIPVGVIVERRKAKSPWIDYLWRPVSVLVGIPGAAPGTALREGPEAILFYAGPATIELHRTEAGYYRDNISSAGPSLWVALRSAASELPCPELRCSELPYEVMTVTADPAEGEALTDAGNNLVEAVPMPPEIIATIRLFVARYHVERPFLKRRRTPAQPAPCRSPGSSENDR